MRQRLQAPENDISYWINNKTPEDLKTFLGNFKSNTQKRAEVKLEGAEKLYEDDNWLVLEIKTYEAAVEYGKNTCWCITGRYPGHENRGREYFNSYLEGSYKRYVEFINKKPRDVDKDGKYMVCPHKNNPKKVDIWDPQDHRPDYIPNCYVKVDGLPFCGSMEIDNGVLKSLKPDRGFRAIIPDIVTEVANRSIFNNNNIVAVEIPDSVTKIGTAFCGYTEISAVKFPDSVKSIGANCCIGCNDLIGVELGTGISKIEKGSFNYCDFLNKVVIKGESVDIDENCFDGLRDSTTVYITNPKNTKALRFFLDRPCKIDFAGSVMGEQDE